MKYPVDIVGAKVHPEESHVTPSSQLIAHLYAGRERLVRGGLIDAKDEKAADTEYLLERYGLFSGLPAFMSKVWLSREAWHARSMARGWPAAGRQDRSNYVCLTGGRSLSGNLSRRSETSQYFVGQRLRRLLPGVEHQFRL